MQIQIFNILSKKKEVFMPIETGKVLMYQCGPTLYWTQHIGNLRSVVIADLIFRTFKYNGFNIKFVRNYTDVGHLTGDNEDNADSGEDRMSIAARRDNLSPEKIAEKYKDQYEIDIKKLNTLPPNKTPLASENIREICEIISILIEKGYAYPTPLAIYFDVSKAKDYNRLSGQDLSKNKKGLGHGTEIDPSKRNPEDFALWFFKAGAHKDALQTWPSPFKSELVKDGIGFPGWHIECSAMINKFLGETIDIHIGGIEHVPTHHTNEIAQSESAFDKPFVKYWIHNEHLLFENSKMSKSAGTSITLNDIEEAGFNPLSLRYLFLQAHYRSKQNFTWDSLSAAEESYKKIYLRFKSLKKGKAEADQDLINQFESALGDDFNTPEALAILHKTLKSDLTDEVKYNTLKKMDEVFGLELEDEVFENENISTKDLDEDLKNLIDQRNEARKNKDFDLADKIRKQIEDLGYTVKDVENETIISKK